MFLALAALLLLITIAVQNWLYPPLRQETISDGLYGPYHWFLDGAYVLLAVEIILSFENTSPLSRALSVGGALTLLATAVTNTFSAEIDRLTGGLHSRLHTLLTIAMFIQILLLEAVNDHGWLGWLSTAGIVLPVLLAAILSKVRTGIVAGPAAEKLAVVLMCGWMIVWSVAR